LRGARSKEGHPGIGLALVYEAVMSAGGTLSIREMSPGTLFLVTVPWLAGTA
jgi:sensor histidine kinase regulating citrate/malate metabolism